MAYQRAQWRSGLTYVQVCETCRTPVSYTDEFLDYRPWYPDGYIDCPVCKNHLRHNEKYAINGPRVSTQFMGSYCTNCGAKLEDGYRFCAICGAPRK